MKCDHMHVTTRVCGQLGDERLGPRPALSVGDEHDVVEARSVARIGVVARGDVIGVDGAPPVLRRRECERGSQRVTRLIYRDGLTFAEAARALCMPIGTVKSRVHTALSTLRAFFEPT